MKKYHPVRYTLDLELEQPKSNPQTKDSLLNEEKIIQIGVVFFRPKTFEVLEKKAWYININTKLSTFIKELTGITQEEVDNGTTISIAVKELQEMCDKYQAFKQPITWGGGDLWALRKEAIKDKELEYHLGTNEFNAKVLYQFLAEHQGIKRRIGLKGAMEKLGLEFEGRAHDAVVDAYNTAKIFSYMTKPMLEIKKHTVPKENPPPRKRGIKE